MLRKANEADVAEQFAMFPNVGLLINESPGRAEMSFTESSDYFNLDCMIRKQECKCSPSRTLPGRQPGVAGLPESRPYNDQGGCG